MFNFLQAGMLTLGVGVAASLAGGVAKGVGEYIDQRKEKNEEEDDDDEEED